MNGAYDRSQDILWHYLHGSFQLDRFRRKLPCRYCHTRHHRLKEIHEVCVDEVVCPSVCLFVHGVVVAPWFVRAEAAIIVCMFIRAGHCPRVLFIARRFRRHCGRRNASDTDVNHNNIFMGGTEQAPRRRIFLA